jgi:hypothetical protein
LRLSMTTGFAVFSLARPDRLTSKCALCASGHDVAAGFLPTRSLYPSARRGFVFELLYLGP